MARLARLPSSRGDEAERAELARRWSSSCCRQPIASAPGPCLCRLFGTQPTPSCKRGRNARPSAALRPLMRMVPRRIAAEAGHRFGDADAAAAGRAGDADDLAAAHREADMGEVVAGEIADLQRNGGVCRKRARAAASVTLNGACSPVMASISCSLGKAATARADDMARVAEHRHRLADLVDFLQMVRDEQEGARRPPATRACAGTGV